MKNFEFESEDICTKVLVIKQKGKISAIGNKCSHYGALLSMGVLGDGRVRCPWYESSQLPSIPNLVQNNNNNSIAGMEHALT